jgi:hypothetical protein
MAINTETCAYEFGCKGAQGGPCLKANHVVDQTNNLGMPNVLQVSKPEFLNFLQTIERNAINICAKPDELKDAIARGRKAAKTHFK